jgi:hypothetical protein
MKPAPPSRTEWALDAELNGGHSVAETIAWASWVADFEDEQVQRRALPVGFVPAECEPRLVTRLRRIFGR